MTIMDYYHNEAMQMYKKGMTDPQIADEMFCHRTTVFDWRKRHGLEPNFQPGCPSWQKWHGRALAMHERGATGSEIARAVHAAPSTVWAWRKRHGLGVNRRRRKK